MSDNSKEIEELKKKLISDIYAGSIAGMPEMLLVESRIMNADDEEIKKIAKEFGY